MQKQGFYRLNRSHIDMQDADGIPYSESTDFDILYEAFKAGDNWVESITDNYVKQTATYTIQCFDKNSNLYAAHTKNWSQFFKDIVLDAPN